MITPVKEIPCIFNSNKSRIFVIVFLFCFASRGLLRTWDIFCPLKKNNLLKNMNNLKATDEKLKYYFHPFDTCFKNQGNSFIITGVSF
jgi:hypothetical protein